MTPFNPSDPQKSDEVITVTLSRSDYETLREIITRQQSLSWLGKWIKNVLFVAAGGIVVLFTFGDHIKHIVLSVLGLGN